MRYPDTAVLSTEFSQLNLISLADSVVAKTLAGTDGGAVSGRVVAHAVLLCQPMELQLKRKQYTATTVTS
jgi:hypothetical protein